jgi:hypothetical protein
MRRQGVSFAVIAEQLGYASAGAAHGAYRDALKDIPEQAKEEFLEDAKMRFDKIIEQANSVIAAQLPVAEAGERGSTFAAKAVAEAHATILAAERDRARMLGIDAPKKIDTTLTVAEISHDDLATRIAALVATDEAQAGPGESDE